MKRCKITIWFAATALMGLSIGCEPRQTEPLEEPVQAPEGADPEQEQQQGQNQQQDNGGQANGGSMDVSDITGEPEQHVGQQVTVQGEVDETYTERSFKLNDQAPLQGGLDDDLIVLGAQNAAFNMNEDSEVRVRGRVEQVDTTNLQNELGWDFDSNLREALEDEQVVVIAESVERVPGAAQ